MIDYSLLLFTKLFPIDYMLHCNKIVFTVGKIFYYGTVEQKKDVFLFTPMPPPLNI